MKKIINKSINKYLKNLKAFIEYSDDMHDVYKNINYYNPNKENKILIVFDDMLADMIQNNKLKFNSYWTVY